MFIVLPFEVSWALDDYWIHFKDDLEVHDAEAKIDKFKLLPVERKSNPFRYRISDKLDFDTISKLEADDYIEKVNQDKTPLIKDHFHSPWGLTIEERDKWTKRIAIGFPAAFSLWGILVWDWGQDGSNIVFRNEKWFNHNSYSGGADKMGHLTALYIQKRLFTWMALQMGHDLDTAQRYGLYASVFTALFIEIGDGTSRYRFAMEDLYMDLLGIGLAWLVDQYPALDRLIAIRWQYFPSREYVGPENRHKLDFVGDYSGQKYFFSVKATGIPWLKDHWATRYLTLDFGFYTRGYKPDFRPYEDDVQYYSIGLGLNLGSIIFESNPTSNFYQTLGTMTKYWIPPGVTHAVWKKKKTR